MRTKASIDLTYKFYNKPLKRKIIKGTNQQTLADMPNYEDSEDT